VSAKSPGAAFMCLAVIFFFVVPLRLHIRPDRAERGSCYHRAAAEGVPRRRAPKRCRKTSERTRKLAAVAKIPQRHTGNGRYHTL
jgi:hypothetical protein